MRQSLVAVRTRVLKSSRSGGSPVKGWRRHIEGWQAGLVAIFIAGTTALFVTHRPVAPVDLPEPMVRVDELAATIRADEALARTLLPKTDSESTRELDYDIRSLGEAIRSFGIAESEDDEAGVERAHREIARAAPAAIARSPEDVLTLRAFHTHEIVREVEAFKRTGRVSRSMRELSGKLISVAEQYGWYDGVPSRFLLTERVLRSWFKKRWNDLTGLEGKAFKLSIDEERVLSRFLIAHPPVILAPVPESWSPAAARELAKQNFRRTNAKRLKKIEEMAELDPEYPVEFAEGVVQFWLGEYERSAVAFQRHLDARPDGPWTLRAQNHLKAALEAR